MREHAADKIDFEILQYLTRDSRLPYRKIALQLELSVNTVKFRIKRMIANHTIQNFTTRVNPSFLGFRLRWLLKTADGQASTEVSSQTRHLGHQFFRVDCVGGASFIGIALREEERSEALQLSKSLRPVIVNDYLLEMTPPNHRFVSSDYAILEPLVGSPKMKISELAEATSLSERTVSRRLESMVQAGVVRFSITADPTAIVGYVRYFLIVKVEESEYRTIFFKIQRELAESLFPSFIEVSPRLLVVNLLCNNVSVLDRMIKAMQRTKGVASVEFYIPLRIRYDEAWVGDEIRNRLASIAAQI
jgi:DNA-binding Lrp family transcriptional regulator